MKKLVDTFNKEIALIEAFSGHCETSRRSFTALAQEDNHTTESGSPAGGLGTISWLPLPLLMIFTAAFNLGLGSLTWVVATEILPVRSLETIYLRI